MFLPAVSVLVVGSTMKEAFRVRWDNLPLRHVATAVFLIPIVMHATMLPVMVALEGGWQWQDWLAPQGDGLYHPPISRGWGALTAQQLVGRIVLNAAVGLIVASFLSFFEEIGWRAWLLPTLMRPGNAGGGKGPYFWCACEGGKER